jgi:hypothetical protein
MISKSAAIIGRGESADAIAPTHPNGYNGASLRAAATTGQ